MKKKTLNSTENILNLRFQEFNQSFFMNFQAKNQSTDDGLIIHLIVTLGNIELALLVF